ncbi:MAG: zinc-binding dehydrogenase [Planctomycetes bacterium]|nr:zinc-binding dehydrogenase [Planctomycetota bacterium]
MKGVRFLGNCQVEVTDLPDPTPDPDQVLIKITASGICGGEVKAYKREEGMDANPGHEVAGIVEDPNGHAQWQKGDRVGIFTLQGCGYCRWCRMGKNDFCAEVKIPKATHSEYTCSRATAMVKLDDDIDDPLAVLIFGDGMGVPYGASTRAKVGPGDVTCVFGCGPVGLGMCIMQSFLGAHVIAVDVVPKRLELAKKFGAWQTIDAAKTEDMVAALRDMTDGIGPDKCFEAVGCQETLDIAMEATAPEGLIVQVGHGKQTLDPQKLISKRNLTIFGNWIYHPGEYTKLLDMQRNGLHAEKLITSTYHFTEAPAAYKAAAEGSDAKIILTYEEKT